MREWLDELGLRARASLKAAMVFLAFAVPAAIAVSVALLKTDNGLAMMAVLTCWWMVLNLANRCSSAVYWRELEDE